ncbi:hypothetical protein BGX27_005707 [Mortierella sp. AM989]|nr:hypothetical protein BGX27_005707 [Mortierella sp. AM989]
MSERKLHPFDSSTTSLPSQLAASPSSPVNVTFHEDAKKGDSLSLDQLGATGQLRNRMDGKPFVTSDPNSPLAVNTTCPNNTTGLETGGSDPSRVSRRRSSGPGGRILEDLNNMTPPRWTAKLSNHLKDLYVKYSPSLTLENKGSIARDHLANERTYLAWLRTSLSLITLGVAVTQLFRLQVAATTTQELVKVSELGRPLGGSFVALGLVFLWLGTSRYFHSQSVLSYGQFPASRGSVIIATVTVLAVVLACFILVILQGRTR